MLLLYAVIKIISLPVKKSLQFDRNGVYRSTNTNLLIQVQHPNLKPFMNTLTDIVQLPV